MALFTVDSERRQNTKNLLKKTLLVKVIYGLCPNCSHVSVFKRYIKLLESCPSCGISFNAERIGDGGAWFTMLITSIIVGFGALILEINFHPKLWVHIIIWLPITILVSIIVLRPFKALLLCLSYKNKE